MQNKLRTLPKVQALLETDQVAGLIDAYGYDDVVDAVRGRLQQARSEIIANDHDSSFSQTSLVDGVIADLEAARHLSLNRAINATGIIIHTNLGRSCLAPEAIEAMSQIAGSYSNLEFDLSSGKRGSRHAHAEALICQLTGAEAALVVNNCAAAILSVLTALGAGQQVIASRGEMVEIGGSFRMPDVIMQSGAKLCEIGTTNKTHLHDYADAICDETAVLLKSHTSNYAVVGFSSVPSRTALAHLANETGTALVEDLGSGVLVDLAPCGLPDEPVVRDVLRAGVDLVTFSGDKLLGGPQAGIIAGRRDLIEKVRKHPITRAVRIDKLSLAALIATLDLYRPPSDPFARVPVLQMLSETAEHVETRANALNALLAQSAELKTSILRTTARAGGGALPQQDLSSFAVALHSADRSPDEIASALRQAPVPVIGRISKDTFMLDMRAVRDAEISQVAASVSCALGQ
jgi:L-seryl-tRNA(Ser) seleniumtransferase